MKRIVHRNVMLLELSQHYQLAFGASCRMDSCRQSIQYLPVSLRLDQNHPLSSLRPRRILCEPGT